MYIYVEKRSGRKVFVRSRYGWFNAELGEDFGVDEKTRFCTDAELDFPEEIDFNAFCVTNQKSFNIMNAGSSTVICGIVISYEEGDDGSGVVCLRYDLDIFQILVRNDNRFQNIIGKNVEVKVCRVVLYKSSIFPIKVL